MWYNFFGDFMLIDTHCHLSYQDYDNLDEIIKSMNGIMIANGCDDKTNKEVLDAKKVYSCENGTLNNNKCIITEEKETHLGCPQGYNYNEKCKTNYFRML